MGCRRTYSRDQGVLYSGKWSEKAGLLCQDPSSTFHETAVFLLEFLSVLRVSYSASLLFTSLRV